MAQLFIYIALCVVGIILGIRILAALAEYIFTKKTQNSFSLNVTDGLPEYVEEPRDAELVGSQKSSMASYIFRKIPSLVTMWSFGVVLSMLFGGYMATANIDRLAAAGAAMQAGNTGLAISYMWPLGKSLVKDQYRASSGSHPILEKYKLENFRYLGMNGDFHIAMLPKFVTAGDIDKSIEPDDEEYSTVLYGNDVENSQDMCESLSGDIVVSLVSKEDWDFSFSHILSKRNINRENDIAEWFNDVDPLDNDNYMLNTKGNSDIESKLKDGDEYIADSKDGIYFDEDDIHDHVKVGFRCVAKWPKGESE